MWYVLGLLFLDDARSKLRTTPEQRSATNKDFVIFLWKWVFFPFAVLLIIGWMFEKPAHGQTISRTFRDANGTSTGRSVTDTKGHTTFYNSLGQNTGRSSTQNGITTIYNERGQQTGTIRSNK